MKTEMVRRDSWSLGDRFFTALMGLIVLVVIIAAYAGISQSRADDDLESRFYGDEVSIRGKEEIGIVTGAKGGKLQVYFPKVGLIPLGEDMITIIKKKAN